MFAPRSAARRMLAGVAIAGAFALFAHPNAHAAASRSEAFPSRPIRLLVPFTPGGSQDVTARIISAPVGHALGQNIVIDNRPGSGGLIATQEAARGSRDGHTLLLSSGAQMAIAPALHAKPGYDPLKSFVHVIHLTDTPLVLIVHPALAATSVKDFIAYTHANRGKINAASTGNGTYTHLTVELFKQQTGADLTHIPYKGAAPAINDLLSQQVHAMFTATASAQPYTTSGRLRAIAVTSARRSPAMPDVPTFSESGVSNLDVSVWVGISAPAGVSPAIGDRLAREFAAALKTAEVRDRLLRLGAEPNGTSGAPFARMVSEDVARWAKIVKAAGVKID
jgi:tripartite-type tricarboxylate transporter receptor subunit TctC